MSATRLIQINTCYCNGSGNTPGISAMLPTYRFDHAEERNDRGWLVVML